MKLLKFTWRTLKTAKLIILVSVLALTLMTNLLIASGGIAFRAATKAYETVTGSRSVATRHADEIAGLRADLDYERRLNRELRGEVAELGAQAAVHRAAVRDTAEAITGRAQTSASRGAKAMVPKAVPYFGTAVIAGVTAMELNDLCQTIKDINALKKAVDPEAEPDDREVSVCSMRVPTRQELWEAAKRSPAQAWAAIAELTPTLEDLQAMEAPDIDWAAYWEATSKSAEDWWAYSANGAANSWDGVKRWWNSEY